LLCHISETSRPGLVQVSSTSLPHPRGISQAPLAGRAAFLTFCVFIALGSLSLVLTILEQSVLGEGNGLGSWWYASTLVSPVAGKCCPDAAGRDCPGRVHDMSTARADRYYLDNAERTDVFKVKIVTSDDEMVSDVVIEGDDEEADSLPPHPRPDLGRALLSLLLHLGRWGWTAHSEIC